MMRFGSCAYVLNTVSRLKEGVGICREGAARAFLRLVEWKILVLGGAGLTLVCRPAGSALDDEECTQQTFEQIGNAGNAMQHFESCVQVTLRYVQWQGLCFQVRHFRL